MKIARPEIRLDGVQIKSLRIARKICKALDVIEEVGGIHSTRITVNRLFVCPDIDLTKLNRTPMERLVSGLLRGKRQNKGNDNAD